MTLGKGPTSSSLSAAAQASISSFLLSFPLSLASLLFSAPFSFLLLLLLQILLVPSAFKEVGWMEMPSPSFPLFLSFIRFDGLSLSLPLSVPLLPWRIFLLLAPPPQSPPPPPSV